MVKFQLVYSYDPYGMDLDFEAFSKSSYYQTLPPETENGDIIKVVDFGKDEAAREILDVTASDTHGVYVSMYDQGMDWDVKLKLYRIDSSGTATAIDSYQDIYNHTTVNSTTELFWDESAYTRARADRGGLNWGEPDYMLIEAGTFSDDESSNTWFEDDRLAVQVWRNGEPEPSAPTGFDEIPRGDNAFFWLFADIENDNDSTIHKALPAAGTTTINTSVTNSSKFKRVGNLTKKSNGDVVAIRQIGDLVEGSLDDSAAADNAVVWLAVNAGEGKQDASGNYLEGIDRRWDGRLIAFHVAPDGTATELDFYESSIKSQQLSDYTAWDLWSYATLNGAYTENESRPFTYYSSGDMTSNWHDENFNAPVQYLSIQYYDASYNRLFTADNHRIALQWWRDGMTRPATPTFSAI